MVLGMTDKALGLGEMAKKGRWKEAVEGADRGPTNDPYKVLQKSQVLNSEDDTLQEVERSWVHMMHGLPMG